MHIRVCFGRFLFPILSRAVATNNLHVLISQFAVSSPSSPSVKSRAFTSQLFFAAIADVVRFVAATARKAIAVPGAAEYSRGRAKISCLQGSELLSALRFE